MDKLNSMEEVRKFVKDTRLFNFIVSDKDQFICYRFVMKLEKLLPPKLRQSCFSKLRSVGDSFEHDLIIEADPEQVLNRYLQPACEDHSIDYYQLEEIKKVALLYCDYLSSTFEDRYYYVMHNQTHWKDFI